MTANDKPDAPHLELVSDPAPTKRKRDRSAEIPRITEKAWQSTVVDTALAFGWRAYHTFDSRHSSPGFPDLVLVHAKRKRLIYAELKTDKGKVSAAQQAWLDDLAACGAQCYVWRPADWPSIVAELGR